MIPMNSKQYATHWKRESEQMDSHGVYERLAKLVPDGRVLEVGCGSGHGTCHLAVGHEVLSVDNNPHLINDAIALLVGNGVAHNIRQCELFDLTAEDKKIFSEFRPEILTGWFIGTSGSDVLARTDSTLALPEKAKQYREKVEDIIVSSDLCLPSVKYIHLAIRGGRVVGFTDADHFKSQKDDFDKYVFSGVGFEVCDVQVFDWPRTGSNFSYSQADNPNLSAGDQVLSIISVLAKRRS